ncbi:hypothetical protein HRbin35_00287 [bacterium HR35]|nr:hypothetical protein HRbin35_00287 [bacterium HR35]
MKKILLILVLILIFNNLALAQEDGFAKIEKEVFRILTNIIRFAFSALMLFGSLVLIFLGLKYIFAKGEVKELHQSFLYVILGLILLIASFFVPNLLKNFIESLRS